MYRRLAFLSSPMCVTFPQKIMRTRKRHQEMFQELSQKFQSVEKADESPRNELVVSNCVCVCVCVRACVRVCVEAKCTVSNCFVTAGHAESQQDNMGEYAPL